MKKYLLPLLLVASAAHAAPLERVSCRISSGQWKQPLIDRAQRALDDAKGHPEQPLVLADAYANLADAVTTATGNPAFAVSKAGTPVQLIQHARDIWSEATPDPALAGQLHERGRQSALVGRCALARPVLQVALDMTEKTKGKESPETIGAVNDLLRVSLASGDSAGVDSLAARLLAALDKGQDVGVNLGQLYEDLGDFYYAGQDYARAESLTRRSLDQAKARLPQDAGLQRTLTNKLASVYYAQLRYAEAEAMIAPFKSSSSASLPEPEAGRRRTMERMAQMVRAGDLGGALALGERTLAQYEEESARSQAVFAEAQATYNSAPKSGPLHDKALTDAQKAYGPANRDMLNVARMQRYLGEIHHAMNQLAAAEQLYLQAQARFAKVKGTFSLDATQNATDLAILYRTRGDLERALPLQEEALKTMLPLLGNDHPDVLESQDELALIYRGLKRYKDAEPLYAAHLQRAERSKAGPQELADQLDALSEIAVAQGDSIKGAFYAQRMVALWEQAGPPQNAQRRAALARLARLYRDSGQQDLAAALEKRLAPPATPPGKKNKG